MYTRNINSKGFSWIAVGKQQWGQEYTNIDAAISVSFPVTYNQVWSILTAPSSKMEYRIGETCNIIQLTNSSFKISSIGDMSLLDFNWISVGKQQWGSEQTTKGFHTITFPVSFSNSLYSVVKSSAFRGSDSAGDERYIVWQNKQQFRMGCDEGGYNWIACGLQRNGDNTQPALFISLFL